MSLSFCVLGSGSGGNCTLVTLGGEGTVRHVLLDAGLSPKRTEKLLVPLGIELHEISDVLLTHVDHDHLHDGWLLSRPRSNKVPRFTWHAHRRHVRRATPARLSSRQCKGFEGTFELGPDTFVETVLLPHDQLGSVGYVIDHRGARLGFATDLGRVASSLLEGFTGLDALAIESNYDPPLQVASERPAMLKKRIMGGLGHLSNEQALDAVLSIDRHGSLRHVVLLHLSRQCNDPGLVRRLYASRAPHLLGRLTITNQRVPTPVLHVERCEKTPVAVGRQLNFLEML